MNGRRITSPYKIAIVWRGDREARRDATPQNNRFHRIFEELAAVGIDAEPAVYDEEFADEVREQLLASTACSSGSIRSIKARRGRRSIALLRDVAARGPWVSAHPDVILKMGVKEVLYRTKHLGWGTDTHLYRTAGGVPRGVPAATADRRPARPEAEPRQWRPGRLEGRAAFRSADGEHGARAARAARQRAGRDAAWRFHGALRSLFRGWAAASSISRFSRACPMA